jgi:hypothetical protein
MENSSFWGRGASVGLTSTTSPGKKDSSGLAGVRDAGEDDVSIAEAFFGGVDSFPFFLRASRSLGSKFAEDEEGTGKEERGARRDGGAGARRVPERLFASFVEKVEGSRRGSDPATNTSDFVLEKKEASETAGHHPAQSGRWRDARVDWEATAAFVGRVSTGWLVTSTRSLNIRNK